VPLRVSGVPCRSGLRARLLLADGTAVEGCGFGAKGLRVGEVVFSTSMTGYTEALTDPSYAGQILVWTHPMVGCYGVPTTEHAVAGVPLNYESDGVKVEGFVVVELPPPNHYLSVSGLSEWLERSGVPGMWRVDTRALVKKLREHGVLMGALAVCEEGSEPSWEELAKAIESYGSYDEKNFAYRVSPREVVVHEPPGRAEATVAVLDCGVKYGIVRWLLRKGFRVLRYPCWSRAEELVEEAGGVLLSNGPGNPQLLKEQAEAARGVLEYGVPVLGICLGMQLLAISLGARTYKLKYGHRGPNKGVVDVVSGRSYITTQNHGYAVEEVSLRGTGLRVWMKNIDDGSLEGLKHEKLPAFAVQFHPEGGPGPHDTVWVFDLFKSLVKRSGAS